jgi:hypothetical protein
MTDLGELFWTDGHERVRVHVDSLRIRRRGAWLEAEIDLEPEPADRRRLHLAVLSSTSEHGDHVAASAALEGRPSPPRCVEFLRRALAAALG